MIIINNDFYDDIFFEKAKIELEEVLNDYKNNSKLLPLYTESGLYKDTNAKDTLKRIKNIIGSSADRATQNSKNLTVNDYIQSDTGKIQVNYDIEGAYHQVRNELAKANSIIRGLAAVTGKTPGEVSEFISDNHSMAPYNIMKTIHIGTSLQKYIKTTNTSIKTLKSDFDKLEKMVDKIEDPEKKKKGMQVAAIVSTNLLEYISKSGTILSKYNKNMKKVDKIHNKFQKKGK